MSNNPPLVGAGAGSEISFSTIRDFYGDNNPVSLSEFARGGSLVSTSFAGSATATTNSVSATKNDFVITVEEDNNSQTIGVSGKPVTFTVDTGTAGGSTVTISLANNNTDEGTASLTRGGNTILSTGGATVTGTVNDNDILTLSGTGNSNPVCSYPRLTRAYDVTFKNNNNTGDTYTLASSSTAYSTKSVYAAQDTQLVKNNDSSNQWTIAYDNVSGSGSGTAGDIGVTVTSQDDAGFVQQNMGNSTASETAPSLSGISFVSVVGSANNVNDDSTAMVTLRRYGSGHNGTIVAQFRAGSGSGSSVTYNQNNAGTAINAGDVFTAGGGDSSNSVRINYTTPSRSIVFQNNGSSSLTIGSNSTGGARTIAAGNSANAQPGGSTNNASWVVYFDTSSGDCNIGIPTTISSGNPVNMDLFNTVTTPVG